MKSSFKILVRFGLILLGGGLLIIISWGLGSVLPKCGGVVFQYLAVCAGFASAFVAFSYAFRHLILGFAVTAGMIVFGLSVYHGPGRTKPSPEVNNEPVAHVVAVADNALSAFFMSRGGYDDFGHESSPSSVPDILWTNVTASLKASSNETAQVAIANAIEKSLTPSETDEKKASESYGDSGIKWYYLFHALSYAFGAAVLGAVFAHRLMNLMFIAIMALEDFLHLKQYAVFWGVCDEAQTVADSMRVIRPIFAFLERKPFVLKRDPTPAEARLNEGSYLWAYVDPDTLKGAFGKLLRRGASEHYFVSPDGQANVAAADVLLKDLENVKAKPKVFVRIDADAEEDVLFKWADSWAEKFKGEGPEIVLIHEPSLVTSKWMANYPANEEAQGLEREGVRLLVVGFGALGKAIFRETVQSCLRPGKHFSATILDRSASAFEPFKPFWDNLKNDEERPAETAAFCIGDAQFGFVEKDVTAPEFWNFLFSLRDQAPNATHSPEIGWTRIVFALPDDLTNLRLAAEFNRQIRSRNLPERSNSQVFAGVRDAGNMAYAKSAFANEGIFLFGNLEDIYADLGARLETEDSGARFLNWRYANQNVSADMFSDAEGFKAWRTASFFDKASSRSAVAGLRTLARKVGFVPCDNHDHDALSGKTLEKEIDAEISRRTKDEIRSLAEIEHLRWCAFLLLRRIRPWYPAEGEIMALSRQRNGSIGNGEKKPAKENDQKEHLRHAALVPFEDLARVAAQFETENKSIVEYESKIAMTDENFVRSMGEILAATGWSFKRKP